jgi:hypothetical protein
VYSSRPCIVLRAKTGEEEREHLVVRDGIRSLLFYALASGICCMLLQLHGVAYNPRLGLDTGAAGVSLMG